MPRLKPRHKIAIQDVVNLGLVDEMKRFGVTPSVSDLFAPHLARTVNYTNKRVIRASLEKFKRRTKLVSDDTIFSLMDLFYQHGFSPILAGGKLISYINGDDFVSSAVSDYDLFMIGEHDLCHITRMINSKDGFYGMKMLTQLPYVTEVIYEKDGVTIKIQLVHKLHACIEHVIESFDIRGCAIAYYKGDILWVKGAIKDVRDKKIVALSPRKDFKVFNRVTKYCNKGWTLDIPDALAFSACALDGILQDFNPHSFTHEQLDAMMNRNSIFARTMDYQDGEDLVPIEEHQIEEEETPLRRRARQRLFELPMLDRVMAQTVRAPAARNPWMQEMDAAMMAPLQNLVFQPERFAAAPRTEEDVANLRIETLRTRAVDQMREGVGLNLTNIFRFEDPT